MGDATNVAFFASFFPRSASQKPIFDPCTYRMADKPIYPKSSLCSRTMMNPALPNFGEYNLLARRDIRGLHFLGLLFLCCGRRATVISCCQCQQGCPRASLSSHRYPCHRIVVALLVCVSLRALRPYHVHLPAGVVRCGPRDSSCGPPPSSRSHYSPRSHRIRRLRCAWWVAVVSVTIVVCRPGPARLFHRCACFRAAVCPTIALRPLALGPRRSRFAGIMEIYAR